MEKALQRSQKLEAVGRLTGGVAHDFNNILQIISGNMQMLEPASGENEQIEARIKNTLEAVDRGAKLSSQLLTFARRQPLQTGVFHIGNRLKRIEGLIQRLVGDAIAINISFTDDLWNTKIDPDLFDNVVMNLAVNARDAMDGKGTISFLFENRVVTGAARKIHPEMEQGEYVLLTVADTGSGMAPEVMERAFEPFFTTKPEGIGTGLGLSMAYGFVKQSGGFIYLASKQGRGTEVRIFLAHTLEQPNNSPELATKRSVGGNESILVVEDDLQVQSTVSSLLSQLGYRVLTAHDAEQALKILEQNKSVDILFADVVLQGGMDGLELGAHAKAIYPELHILLTSGFSYDSIRNKDRLDQNIHVLKKPYKREQLDAAIQDLLRRS
ncbi:ATP-binding protein [Oxalobacteraceae bacterium R-40]|uniref:histidine kinase n=1 Tax=Keguizhuia sedimenti TaxID=3064264 RepID=A0ABU1BLP0_9BURK|nr:ATP-binding protein [Oxalobacteraceae bacterium R-40]